MTKGCWLTLLFLAFLVIVESCSIFQKRFVCLTGMMENQYEIFQNESLTSKSNYNWFVALIVLDGNGIGYYYYGYAKENPVRFEYRFAGDTLVLSSHSWLGETSPIMSDCIMDTLSLYSPIIPKRMLKKGNVLIDISEEQPPLYRMKYLRMIQDHQE